MAKVKKKFKRSRSFRSLIHMYRFDLTLKLTEKSTDSAEIVVNAVRLLRLGIEDGEGVTRTGSVADHPHNWQSGNNIVETSEAQQAF